MRSLRDWFNWFLAELRHRLTGKTYEIVFSEDFKRQLAELPEGHQKKILERIERLKKNPYSGERVYEE